MMQIESLVTPFAWRHRPQARGLTAMPGFSARPPGCGVKGSAELVSRLRRLLCECEWSALAAAALDNGPAIARDEACRESEAFSSFMRAGAEPMPPFCPAIARLADTRIILSSSASILLCFHPSWKKSCSVARYSFHVLSGSLAILQ